MFYVGTKFKIFLEMTRNSS